jgi:hypothetical protein
MLPGKRRVRRNKRRKMLGPILLIGIMLIAIIYGYAEEYSLRKNHEITTGLIIDCRYPGSRGALRFYFDYEVDGKKYQQSSVIPKLRHARDFVGKQFPVAYKKNDAGKCRLLITRSDFKKLSIPFPDSLKWVCGFEE